MDDTQLKAALLDLAEFGIVYLNTPEDAEQVYNALPEGIRHQYVTLTRLFNIHPRYCVYKWRRNNDEP